MNAPAHPKYRRDENTAHALFYHGALAEVMDVYLSYNDDDPIMRKPRIWYTPDDIENGSLEQLRNECCEFAFTFASTIAGREEEAGREFMSARNGFNEQWQQWPHQKDGLRRACGAFPEVAMYYLSDEEDGDYNVRVEYGSSHGS